MSAIGQNPAPEHGPSGESAEPQGSPFDFEHGYKQLHPEYTRSRQELSETRERLSEYETLFAAARDGSDPEAQQAALELLGFEMDTGSPEPDPRDDEFVDPLEQEVEELRAWKEEVQAARELEASEREQQEIYDMRDDFIGEAIGVIEDNLKPQYGDNFKFTEREEEVLGNLAIAMQDERGIPDVQGAYDALYGSDSVLETNRARWVASKTGAVSPPPGSTIPADQKPKTARERARYIDERVAAMERLQ